MESIAADTTACLAVEIDEACRSASYLHQVADEVERRGVGAERRLAALAFKYMPAHGDRKRSGLRFGPMAEFDDGTELPEPLAEVDEETCKVWSALADHVTESRAAARLNDLLYERRWGDVGQHMAHALAAYVEVGRSEPEPSIKTVQALGRALELARLAKRTSDVALISTLVVEAADRTIARGRDRPGVALGLIEHIAGDMENIEVDRLLSQFRATWTGSLVAEQTIELQRKRALDQPRREALDRELAEMLLAEGLNEESSLGRIVKLERAARIAQERGLKDVADQAAVEMQSGPPPELQRIQTRVNIDGEAIERSIESLIGGSFWETMLRVLIAGPPSGDYAENRSQASELAEAFPLSAILPKVKLGGDGLPRYQAETDEEQVDDRVVDVEIMSMTFRSQFVAEALRRSVERTPPKLDELASTLEDAGRSASTSAAIARSVGRFVSQDYDGCTITLLPLVERLCRDLLLTVDAPLYRVRRQRTRAQYPGLGWMLSELRDRGLDESWYRYLRALFSAPGGANLRNEALHGFIDEFDIRHASLVLVAAVYLAGLGTGPAPSAS